MLRCTHCQSTVPEGENRCSSCGSARLERIVEEGSRPMSAATPTPAPAPPPAEAPPPPPKKSAPSAQKAPRSSGGGWLRWVALGMLLLLFVGGVTIGALVWIRDRGAGEGADSSLASIKTRGKLRVVADPNAPPFLMPDPAGGYSGYEWAVMSALQAVAGVPIEVVPAPYVEIPKRLRRGDADLAIGQLTWDPSWKDLTPSVSYLQYSLCLVVPASSPVTELTQLTGQKIGIYEDPSTKRLISASLGDAWQPVIFKDYGYFEQLATGQLSAVVYDCPLVRHELRRFPGLKVADDSLSVASYSVLARSNSTDLMAKVNAVLVDLGNQGLLGKMEDRWLGSRPRGVRGRVVVVLPGETLESIAARELGSAQKATELYERNRDVLGSDPTAVYAGMRLRLGPR